MNAPDPNYDLQGALETLAPGYVMQPEMIDAAASQYAANNYTPLTAAQAQAICLAQARIIQAEIVRLLPPGADPYPDELPPAQVDMNLVPPQFDQGLPRFPDSNESPFDGWVQYGPELQGATG